MPRIRPLRRRYDHVVADSAPVLKLSGAKIVSRLVDATILAVRWRSTSPTGVLRRDRDQDGQCVKLADKVRSGCAGASESSD